MFPEPDDETDSPTCRLRRVRRIALIEAEKPETSEEIGSRIARQRILLAVLSGDLLSAVVQTLDATVQDQEAACFNIENKRLFFNVRSPALNFE